ncbi:hypothetical protein AMTRI_Chr03g50380 [Amborella trichopoda]
MIVCCRGWLICNTRQAQARDLEGLLQSRSRLSCREEEGIGMKVEPLGKGPKEGKFTWQVAIVNIPTTKIEARKAMNSGHCRAERNQPLNQGPITG